MKWLEQKVRELEAELDEAETDDERIRISDRLSRAVYELGKQRRKRAAHEAESEE